jgi:hypothetical protein
MYVKESSWCILVHCTTYCTTINAPCNTLTMGHKNYINCELSLQSMVDLVTTSFVDFGLRKIQFECERNFKILREILSIPQDIVMDFNNVMERGGKTTLKKIQKKINLKKR